MAVVIKDFEVMSAAPEKDGKSAEQKKENGGKSEQKPTDHELGKMLEKRLERLERITAH